MTEKPRINCYEIADIKCCTSCHNEWDEGYGDPFEEEHEDYIWVRCCSPSREPTPDEVNEILKKRAAMDNKIDEAVNDALVLGIGLVKK